MSYAGDNTREGPAAVAVGRAIARGANPVVTDAAGKLATTINKKYQIVFVASEVAPWSKTGGLGEAMDGLPIALAALGHRVMTIAPRYDQYAEAWLCENVRCTAAALYYVVAQATGYSKLVAGCAGCAVALYVFGV